MDTVSASRCGPARTSAPSEMRASARVSSRATRGVSAGARAFAYAARIDVVFVVVSSPARAIACYL